MTELSIVIPHKNRSGMLNHHLARLEHQTTKQFEVIIVDDHSKEHHREAINTDRSYKVTLLGNTSSGPASARNLGAETADTDIVLFVGDDCLPLPDLVFRHLHGHWSRGYPLALQGFSPFAPQVMSTRFMYWLDRSGIQANWNALINEDATPKVEAHGFCLTTNYSIDRQTFLDLGGFDSHYFTSPAWEDVAFGYIGHQQGLRTYFDPLARNAHYHEYDLPAFMERQRMVGANVLALGLKHSETINTIFQPEELRFARQESVYEYFHKARQLEMANDQRIQPVLEETWGQCIRLSMLDSILLDMDIRGGPWQVFEHLHKSESVAFGFEGIRGVRDKNYGWSMHQINWMIESAPDNWAVYCYAGEILRLYDLREDARYYYMKSLEIAPNEWATNSLSALA